MLTSILIGAAFIVGTIALSLLVYFLGRAVTGGDRDGKHREMASSMVVRIAALHGLILALVFAQEMLRYQQLDMESATEASAIADVYNDASRYGAVFKPPVQQALAEYVRIVLDEEWGALGEGRGLSPNAWAQWDIAYEHALDLQPTSPRETALRDHMLERLHDISKSRDLRSNNGQSSLNAIFWFAAISGVVLISFGYYVYPPVRHHLALMSLFSAYTGIVLFLIYAFSNPYSPPGALEPTPFVRLSQEFAPSA